MLRLWRAGHPLPVFLEGTTVVPAPVGEPGVALGVLEGHTWTPVDRPVGMDTSLLLFTDGLIEGFDGHPGGRRLGELALYEMLAELLERRAGPRPAAGRAADRGPPAQRRRAHRRRRGRAPHLGGPGVSESTLRRRLVMTFVALAALIVGPGRRGRDPVGAAVRRPVGGGRPAVHDRTSAACGRERGPARPGDRVPRLRPHRQQGLPGAVRPGAQGRCQARGRGCGRPRPTTRS